MARVGVPVSPVELAVFPGFAVLGLASTLLLFGGLREDPLDPASDGVSQEVQRGPVYP